MMAVIKILILICSLGIAAGSYEVEYTCSDITDAKVSYFVSPRRLFTNCTLKVNLNNTDVQQIRLDFESFLIAPPTSLFLTNSSYQCHHDYFTVTAANTNLGFPSLCGENTGQHIYVNILNTTSISLNFTLAGNRSDDDIYPLFPYWAIRITQLEAYTDALVLAPAGCLQYFTRRTGTYETFNYNRGWGPYIGQTGYAICFHRPPNACGIRHTPIHFGMNYNLFSSYVVVCNPNGTDYDNSFSNDYLFIPGGVYNGSTIREYFCDSLLNSALPVRSKMPGPFYVAVKTDDTAQVARDEGGFKIYYEVLTECHKRANFTLPDFLTS